MTSITKKDILDLAQSYIDDKHWMPIELIQLICQYHETRGGGRRTKIEMAALEDAIHYVTEKYNVITLRGLYYQIVSTLCLMPKTEGSYQRIAKITGNMRKSGLLKYEKLSDNTRWMRKPTTHVNLKTAMEKTHRFYRRDLWATQDAYVEIWCEKDAMAGILYEITEEYDVPLMISRGYASLSYLYSAAQAINRVNENGKHAFLYHYGDYDPSGQDIPRAIEQSLQSMVKNPNGFTFETMAVLPKQIMDLALPTRPTKKSDSRAKNFQGDSVELDAIPPDVVQGMVRSVIEQHIDAGEMQRIKVIEEAERDTLAKIAEKVA